MKKLLLTAVVCMIAIGASAEIKYKGLDNINGTNIVLVDDKAPQKVEITDAVFYNNGSRFPAKQIRCDLVNGVATYKLKFKRFAVFKNCKVVLTVNGKEEVIDIQKSLLER